MIKHRKFVCYFYFVGWHVLSLGLSICILQPNIEIHIPFGFIRIGWEGIGYYDKPSSEHKFGYDGNKDF